MRILTTLALTAMLTACAGGYDTSDDWCNPKDKFGKCWEGKAFSRQSGTPSSPSTSKGK